MKHSPDGRPSLLNVKWTPSTPFKIGTSITNTIITSEICLRFLHWKERLIYQIAESNISKNIAKNSLPAKNFTTSGAVADQGRPLALMTNVSIT